MPDMNAMKPKRQRRKLQASVPVPQAIECDGSELCMVLAKLRRQGRTPGEPQKIAPNRWRVIPGGSEGAFKRDAYGQEDHAYHFGTFDQGARGNMTLDY
jgi:hypothetical protein